MDRDLDGIDADRRNVAAHRFGDGEQACRLRAGFEHLRSCRGIMAEMADVGAARLGREGKTERIGDAHRGGAVGVEERSEEQTYELQATMSISSPGLCMKKTTYTNN